MKKILKFISQAIRYIATAPRLSVVFWHFASFIACGLYPLRSATTNWYDYGENAPIHVLIITIKKHPRVRCSSRTNPEGIPNHERTFPVATPFLPRSYSLAIGLLPRTLPVPSGLPSACYSLVIPLQLPYHSFSTPMFASTLSLFSIFNSLLSSF